MKEKLVEIDVSKLVMDYNIYPRTKVESFNVNCLVDAMEAGITLPPIVIDSKTKRIVDGFHRTEAYKKLGKETIPALSRTYKSEKDLFLDCINLNAGHGRQFSTYDKARCIHKSLELGIDISKVALSLNLTVDKATTLSVDRGAIAANGADPVTLKRTIQYKKGQQLTARQVEVIPKIGGQQALYYVNQLVLLFQNDLIDLDNMKLMEGLKSLKTFLDGIEDEIPIGAVLTTAQTAGKEVAG